MAMLTDAGHQAYFVGGCVRDALIGRAGSDIDVTTDALPDQVIALAKAARLRAIPTGVEHGTVTVISGRPFEVTTFRRDVETDGRHAVVAFAKTLEEDAARRDLTINALYADSEGRVFDPVGGAADLQDRRLRFIGVAKDRIREDYLRSLRYFRFYAWFGDPDRGPDPDALAAISANLVGLDTVSKERIGAEVLKMLSAPDPAPAVAIMAQTGALARILPGADPVAMGPLVMLEGDWTPNPIRRLAALISNDNGDNLRLSRRNARGLDLIFKAARSGMPAHEAGYRLGADMGFDAVLVNAALMATPIGDGAHDAVLAGAAAKFPVSAADLTPLEGPALGEKLKSLEADWIASRFQKTKASLLD